MKEVIVGIPSHFVMLYDIYYSMYEYVRIVMLSAAKHLGSAREILRFAQDDKRGVLIK